MHAHPSALGTIKVYRDDSVTPVVYEDTKHVFWTANNTVLTIAQVTDAATGQHRYVHWPRERFCWYVYDKPVPRIEFPAPRVPS